MNVEYREMNCTRVLDSYGIVGTRFWTRHCFDPYVNCEFNCVYCDKGTEKRVDYDNSSAPVYVKQNAPQVLDKELTGLKRKGALNLGVATDIYQQAEEKFCITRKILEVLKKHSCPFAIGTKSDLVLRDLDLIRETTQKAWGCVSLSISTLDENLARKLEPNASSPTRRLDAMQKLSDAGIMTGIWFSPIVPYITDDEKNMADVIRTAVEKGAEFVLGVGLDTRDIGRFKRFLEEQYPRLAPKYDHLYRETDGSYRYYACESYLYNLYEKLISLCNRYGVKSFLPHFHTRRQAWLFYLRNFSRFEGTPVFEANQLLNYLSPSKEFLQTVRIRWGNRSISQGFLKAAGYFPH